MKFETEINFQSNTWNRDAWARIQADLNSEKETICYTTGTILGVRPGQAVKELCGFETFLCTRLMPATEIGRATSELQSHHDLVCRLLLEKKKKIKQNNI